MTERNLPMVASHPHDAAAEAAHKAPKAAAESERRREQRHKGPKQVWIQGVDSSGAPVEEVQMMRNFSRGGFYFVTNLHCYRVGMTLHVIPSFGSLSIEYVAEVVRVEPKPKMAYGVGVKLLRVHDPIAPRSSPRNS